MGGSWGSDLAAEVATVLGCRVKDPGIPNLGVYGLPVDFVFGWGVIPCPCVVSLGFPGTEGAAKAEVIVSNMSMQVGSFQDILPFDPAVVVASGVVGSGPIVGGVVVHVFTVPDSFVNVLPVCGGHVRY